MYKLRHSVCVSLTLMNMSLNVIACLLSGCSAWNVLNCQLYFDSSHNL